MKSAKNVWEAVYCPIIIILLLSLTVFAGCTEENPGGVPGSWNPVKQTQDGVIESDNDDSKITDEPVIEDDPPVINPSMWIEGDPPHMYPPIKWTDEEGNYFEDSLARLQCWDKDGNLIFSKMRAPKPYISGKFPGLDAETEIRIKTDCINTIVSEASRFVPEVDEDGFFPDVTKIEAITYQEMTHEHFKTQGYFGKVNGCEVVLMPCGAVTTWYKSNTFPDYTCYSVAGTTFILYGGFIIVWKQDEYTGKGVCYNLADAYDLGILNTEDVQRINELHRSTLTYQYALLDESFGGQ